MSLKNMALLVASFILVFTLGIIFGICLSKFFTPSSVSVHPLDQPTLDATENPVE